MPDTEPAPRFSVVVPAFEREATVARTVRSVLDQDTRDLELVVVDDGSTDATTAAAVAAIGGDPRGRVLTVAHAGVSAARNAGAHAARGRFLTFLDADDEVDPAWLTRFAVRLRAGEQPHDDERDLVFGASVRRWPDGRELLTYPEPLGPSGHGLTGTWSPGSFAVRREVFQAVGGYAVPLAYSENTELGLRLIDELARRGRTASVTHHRDPLVIHHMPAGAWTNAWSDPVRFASALYVASTHERLLRRDPAQLASYWAIAGVAAARMGRGVDARRLFARAWRADRRSWRSVRQIERWASASVPAVRRRRWRPSAGPAVQSPAP